MAKVHPQEPSSSSACSISSYTRQTYTVWMKSLVFHSNGCTVYDCNGDIVYRVDNYDKKGTRLVHLMDIRGRVLCTIHKRILGFGRWDVYRGNDCKMQQEKPWFQVKTSYKMTTRKIVSCKIALEGCQKFCIERTIGGKTAFRILNMNGHTVAHAKQKRSCSGIVLGNDVLALDVVADTDHSLIMAFVTVFGLICGRM